VNHPQGAPYPPPPGPYGITQNDESELTLLSILFFVYAGLIGLLAIVLGGFAIIPALMITTAASPHARQGGLVIGGVFLAVFGALALFLVAKSVLMVVAGRSLARRTNYALCMVGACVSLMNIPLGTALGIFAIVVLQRPAVKARFS
jgi:hypothetical protein